MKGGISRYVKPITTRTFLVRTSKSNIPRRKAFTLLTVLFNSIQNKLTPNLSTFNFFYVTFPISWTMPPTPAHAPPHSTTTVIANPFSNRKDKGSDSVVFPRLSPEFHYIDWPLFDCRKIGDGKSLDDVDLVLHVLPVVEILGDIHKYIEPSILPGLMFENVEMVAGAVAVELEVEPGRFIDLPYSPLEIGLPLVYLPLREVPRA